MQPMKILMLGAMLATLPVGSVAHAQLLETPATTTALTQFKGYAVSGRTLTRGKTSVTLDVAGGRVVGLLVHSDNPQDVARALAAAWGGAEANVSSLAQTLGRAGVRQEARSAQGLRDDSDGSLLRVRLSGTGGAERWTAYTALLVHPDSAFPAPTNAEGNPKAPNVLRVFSDFQCPYCKELWDTAHRDWAARPNVYRVIHHHFPLDFHPNAEPAAIASECAARQGKFWTYADLLFGNFAEWTRLPSAATKFSDYARSAGLNLASFKACLTDPAPRATVRSQQAAGLRLGVQGTPTVYLNGVQLLDHTDPEEMAAVRAVTTAVPNAAQVIGARLGTLR
ncbi:DsbA family protein [Deinococcus sp. NW-56]|uniref:DsbA family protein n=1 Tax=Deinococcus sp. NW-56 TaxID=2080419 RepID=UPI000CF4984A|nr:DsbA family protein [Deinococcus sp. NW-56]